MRRLILGLLIALVFGCGVGLIDASQAIAAPLPTGAPTVGMSAADPPLATALAAPPAPVTTAPTGKDLERKQQAADAANTKRKIIIGLIVVVLLVIVIIGHRSRSKNRARKKKLQQAQGG